MSEHEELEQSVAAWVLDAVEADEAAAIRVHIETCQSCREMAARLRRVIGTLPLSVEEVVPAARLRARILSAAKASRPGVPFVDARAKNPTRLPQPKPLVARSGGHWSAYAAAAGIVLALLVGLVAGDLVGRGAASSAPNQVARFSLTGHQELAGARASVIELKSDAVALVNFNGLPELASGKVYEVWLITANGRADPAGVFVPDSNGTKVVLVNSSLKAYTQMAVTIEIGPDGPKAPTKQPQLYGSLA